MFSYNFICITDIKKEVIIIKKDKQITFQISDKMLDDFNKKCKEKEVTKSEILRDCIRSFLEKK